MSTTRFCPTANGDLHVGHAYLALLNYHAAKSTGGKFIVRFDDAQRYWLEKYGKEGTECFCKAMAADLGWLGMEADVYSWESRDREANEDFMLDHSICGHIDCLEHGEDIGFPTPAIKTCDRAYPYVPYLTATKVAQDAREGVDLVIRGTDLVTEYALYCYFCKLMDLPIPVHQYVPKLMRSVVPYGKGALVDLSDLSKHDGGFKIKDYRNAHWEPKAVIAMLAESCLQNPARQWKYENVKLTPILASAP
jgi:glutamyl/glutaminyl-tRNA synthetase